MWDNNFLDIYISVNSLMYEAAKSFYFTRLNFIFMLTDVNVYPLRGTHDGAITPSAVQGIE